MFVFKAAVLGAGTMGGEIAQVIASADVPVQLKDVEQELVDAGLEKAREVTPGHAILASNTSSLPVSEIGSATTRPDKVVGFHFFWPASVMRLIEVVVGEDTSEESAQAAANFAMQIRKSPIRCAEEPGFVVNRIMLSAGSEIWRHQDESGDSPQDIDKEILEAKMTPMGPFFLADMSGLDVTLHVATHMRESYGDRFYVHPTMKELVEAGNLGQKTGRGYYQHGGEG